MDEGYNMVSRAQYIQMYMDIYKQNLLAIHQGMLELKQQFPDNAYFSGIADGYKRAYDMFIIDEKFIQDELKGIK
jgi:hypothetical protein